MKFMDALDELQDGRKMHRVREPELVIIWNRKDKQFQDVNSKPVMITKEMLFSPDWVVS